jgi:hypothetical protein
VVASTQDGVPDSRNHESMEKKRDLTSVRPVFDLATKLTL